MKGSESTTADESENGPNVSSYMEYSPKVYEGMIKDALTGKNSRLEMDRHMELYLRTIQE